MMEDGEDVIGAEEIAALMLLSVVVSMEDENEYISSAAVPWYVTQQVLTLRSVVYLSRISNRD